METTAIAPLIVIVGPTASGKTSLAITLAERFGGEIICADSRTVYEAMDIGTAKPTKAEQRRVPHWGLDLVKPGEVFTAADFKIYALNKISDIRSRGKIPFLVGGTGLYVDAVVYNYQFGDKADLVKRERLQKMSVEELQKYCNSHNIILPENSHNKRYLIRTIEQGGVNNHKSNKPIDNSIIVGIATNREILRTRIVTRAEQLFENSVVDEAIKLGKLYGWDNEAMTGNIYPLVREYQTGNKTLSEIKEKFITLDWRLAKRQLTWLKRNEYIMWLDLEKAEHYLSDTLAPYASS